MFAVVIAFRLQNKTLIHIHVIALRPLLSLSLTLFLFPLVPSLFPAALSESIRSPIPRCIPYKLTDENGYQINDRIKVLMVSTPDRDDLVFPKGGWEDDETVEEAACREAWEEAGVIGIIGKTLGEWEFRSKSRQEICSLEGGCKGRMFAMKVTKEHEVWPEQKNHDRKWLNIEDANRLCRYEWMRSALNEFLRIMAEDVRHETVDATVQTSSTPVSGIAAECEVESSYHRMKPSNTRRRVPPLRCSRSKTFIRRRPKLGAISPTTNSTQLNLKGTA